MATMSISLLHPMREWNEFRAEKLKAMQSAITKGIESGEAKPFDSASFKQRMMEKQL